MLNNIQLSTPSLASQLIAVRKGCELIQVIGLLIVEKSIRKALHNVPLCFFLLVENLQP